MDDQTTPAGAMPVAVSAMLTQSYPSGPVFAAYRLRAPGLAGAREAGVCFDGEPAGGASPPAGAPPANPPAGDPPANPPAPPATGDPADLGDAGKRALESERATARAEKKRADDAVKALEELKLAGASDSEKAIAKAKADAAAESTTKWTAQIRRAEVKAALAAAGINASVLDLAINAGEFADLKVSDQGEVEGLAGAVEAFKKARKDLFTAPVTPGAADGGNTGNGKTITQDQIKEMAKTPGALTAALEKGELDSVLKRST